MPRRWKTIVQAEGVIEEDSDAKGSGDVVQEIPVRAILGQTSGVDALRGRLKELRRLGVTEAAVYGTKQQLWERLVMRETFYGENERVRKAILDRHRRIQEGSDPEVPATLKVPEKPDAETVKAHELTHMKFEP